MSRAYRLIRATCVCRQKDKPADISTIMVKKDEANSNPFVTPTLILTESKYGSAII